MLLAATLVSAEDSPLVALAKRANRAKSKTTVITNETVLQSKGRFSQAPGAAMTTVAPLPSTPAAAAPTPPASPAARAPRESTTQPGEIGSGAYGASSARMIEPQSTARNITPTAAPIQQVEKKKQ
jgi:hypothetical protein